MGFKFSDKMSDKAKASFEEKFKDIDENLGNSIIEYLDVIYAEHAENVTTSISKAVEDLKKQQAKEAEEAKVKQETEAKAAEEARQKAFSEALKSNAVKIKRLFNEVDDDNKLAESVRSLGNTPEVVDFLAKLGDKFEYENGPQGGQKTDKDKVKTHEEVVEEQLKEQKII